MSPAEEQAMVRAVAYMRLDPIYEDKELTRREEMLMRLAIRAFSQPGLTVREITRLRETARA